MTSKRKFCSLPFTSVVVDNKANSINMRPCCRYRFNSRSNNIDEFFHSEKMEELRQYFREDRDELPAGCISCSNEEHKGIPSFRQNIEKLTTSKDVDTANPSLTLLGLDIGFTCNMSCYMCSADVSSAFAAEYKALNWQTKSKITDADYSDVLLTIPKSTRSIGYVNGEFFLDKTGNDVLSIVADRNIELTITTNSSYITDKHIDKLKNINKNISVSLDGVDDLYPIMRYPISWQTFNSVFEKIVSMPNIQSIMLKMVIQNLNVFDMINVMKFGYQHNISTRVTLVHSNPWLMFDALDDADRNNAIAMLTSQLDIERIRMTSMHVSNVEEYIQLLKNTVHDPVLNNQLVSKLAKIWKHRNLDYSYYQNIYPTLYRKIVDHNEQIKI